MKLLVLAAVCLGLAAAVDVCVPKLHTVDIQGWGDVADGYVFGRDFLDVDSQKFRRADIGFFEQHRAHKNVMQDIIVLAKESKIYRVTGTYHKPETYHCQVINQKMQIPDPCFHNTTKLSTDLIGLTRVDSFYGETSHHGVKVHHNIHITPGGIPVNVAEWDSYEHKHELFENFMKTVPTNAFDVPKICQSAQESTEDAYTVLKKMGMHRRVQLM
eukprot:NODE_1546_length_818_cov_106.182344_g1498_i0.p1 GENE.NODE_1546_length_818_cov_106.182344_g1498_i0~~NODE_1546_length_818_cov_106.182344_g1498_i0.p1  ORF type:complete len:215 (+),score=59.59 NODE_1546_length_818_cov_106.182344_g1498_i0:72-716(+)